MLDVENDKISSTEYVPEDEQNVLDNELTRKESNASEYVLSEDKQNVLDNELPHKESSGSEYLPSEDEQNALDDTLPQKRKSILNTTEISTSSLDASQINNGASICNDVC